jgi:uncharacterized protein GlcG (DUF336 family)
MRTRVLICALTALLVAMPTVRAQALGDKKVLTLEIAKKMAEAAEKAALANKWNMSIIVLDDGGNLLYLERMNDASIASTQIAQQKAHTAVIFKSPSKDFQEGLGKGNMSYLKLDALPFEGGIPIIVGGKLIGAIGVSGGTAVQDGQVAKAGADWLTANVK